MIRVSFGSVSSLKAVVAFVVLLALFAGGCSIGDSEKKEKYINKINELVKQDDKEVEDYNDSVAKFGMGQISAESMVIIADKRNKATLDLVQKELSTIEVPEDFMEGHKLMISGYNKTAQGYEFDRDFYSGAGGEAAGIKARELFTEGNTEINQATSMMNQKR